MKFCILYVMHDNKIYSLSLSIMCSKLSKSLVSWKMNHRQAVAQNIKIEDEIVIVYGLEVIWYRRKVSVLTYILFTVLLT